MHDRSNYELKLHRAARAGDMTAKRELETRELVNQADNQTRTLRDKAIAGDAASMAALRRLAKGSPRPVPATTRALPAQPTPSASAVRAEERQRLKTVFASEASKGRERLCASLLSANEGWTAGQIVAQLPNLSTDQHLEQEAKSERAEEASKIWVRAREGIA